MSGRGFDVGILVGRPTLSKTVYEYLIIPRRDDVDTYTTTLPPDVMSEMYTVNTRGVVKLLKHMYLVEFRWRAFPTVAGGVLYKATVTSARRVEVDLQDPAGSLRQVDQDVEYHAFKEPPVIDEKFIASLSRSSGAGIGSPKRFHATAVVTQVRGEGSQGGAVPLTLNIAEAFLWMQENPGRLRGVAFLKGYKYAVLVADTITSEELVEDILNRQVMSLRAYDNAYNRASSIAIGTSQAEEPE